MGMRRLFIIRKDLHLSAGKLGANIAPYFFIKSAIFVLLNLSKSAN